VVPTPVRHKLYRRWVAMTGRGIRVACLFYLECDGVGCLTIGGSIQ
jgi:hypothetical protein